MQTYPKTKLKLRLYHRSTMLTILVWLLSAASSLYGGYIPYNPNDPVIAPDSQEVRLKRLSKGESTSFSRVFPAMLYQRGPASNFQPDTASPGTANNRTKLTDAGEVHRPESQPVGKISEDKDLSQQTRITHQAAEQIAREACLNRAQLPKDVSVRITDLDDKIVVMFPTIFELDVNQGGFHAEVTLDAYAGRVLFFMGSQ